MKAALEAMSADELRSLIRDLLPWFDEALRARFANALVDRAARNGSGWVPQGPTDAAVKDIEEFAEAAKRIGHADPAEVDAYLREGAKAFSARTTWPLFRYSAPCSSPSAMSTLTSANTRCSTRCSASTPLRVPPNTWRACT
jgi:hypothetical protein